MNRHLALGALLCFFFDVCFLAAAAGALQLLASSQCCKRRGTAFIKKLKRAFASVVQARPLEFPSACNIFMYTCHILII